MGVSAWQIFGTIGLDGLDGAVRDLRAFDSAGRLIAGSLGGLSGKALATAAAYAAIGVAAAAVGVKSVSAFGEFDEALTRSLSIMGNLSDVERGEMSDAAREIGRNTRFSATEAADSYYYLASAGMTAAQAIAALPVAARFATAGNMDLKQSVSLLINAQTALGMRSEDATQNMTNMAQVADVLARASKMTDSTIEQLSNALTDQAAASLKAFNKDIVEGAAVLAAFAAQGVKGDVAGTSLSRVLRLLADQATIHQQAFTRLGVTVYDANGKMLDMADIVGSLERALNGLSDQQKIVALDALGFKSRIQQVILPLIGTSEAIRKYEADLRAAGGTTKEVADKQLNTLRAEMDLMKGEFKDMGISIGGFLAPGLEAALKSFHTWAEEMHRGLRELGDDWDNFQKKHASGAFSDTIGEKPGEILDQFAERMAKGEDRSDALGESLKRLKAFAPGTLRVLPQGATLEDAQHLEDLAKKLPPEAFKYLTNMAQAEAVARMLVKDHGDLAKALKDANVEMKEVGPTTAPKVPGKTPPLIIPEEILKKEQEVDRERIVLAQATEQKRLELRLTYLRQELNGTSKASEDYVTIEKDVLSTEEQLHQLLINASKAEADARREGVVSLYTTEQAKLQAKLFFLRQDLDAAQAGSIEHAQIEREIGQTEGALDAERRRIGTEQAQFQLDTGRVSLQQHIDFLEQELRVDGITAEQRLGYEKQLFEASKELTARKMALLKLDEQTSRSTFEQNVAAARAELATLFADFPELQREFEERVATMTNEAAHKVYDMEGQFRDAGKALIMGLVNGTQDMEQLLKSEIISLVLDYVFSPLHGLFKFGSPSRVAIDWGRNIVLGLAHGIAAEGGTLEDAVRGAAATVTSGLSGPAIGSTTRSMVMRPMSGQPSFVLKPDFTGLPAATNPLAAARDREWQKFFRETSLAAKSEGFR